MATPVQNLALGVGVVVMLATVAFGPTIAGVSPWKWALGVLGVVLFVLAERRGRT